MSVDAKTCLITGGGRGIGRATVRRLVAGGARVLAVARTAADLIETQKLSANGPGRCEIFTADITRPEQARAAVDACRERFGRLDVLVNNAGAAPLATIERFTDTMLEEVVEVNIKAVVYLCRAAWPLLGQSRGVIINISSVAAADPFRGFAVYGGTKAWVNVFSRALAEEGRPLGIRVFALGPGAVETQMLRQAFPSFPAEQALAPEDVAEAIEWLLDERCRHMTGQTLYVRR